MFLIRPPWVEYGSYHDIFDKHVNPLIRVPVHYGRVRPRGESGPGDDGKEVTIISMVEREIEYA